jgi:hypothetical protein
MYLMDLALHSLGAHELVSLHTQDLIADAPQAAHTNLSMSKPHLQQLL